MEKLSRYISALSLRESGLADAQRKMKEWTNDVPRVFIDLAKSVGFIHVVRAMTAVVVPGNHFVAHVNFGCDEVHGMHYCTLGFDKDKLSTVAKETLNLRAAVCGGLTGNYAAMLEHCLRS